MTASRPARLKVGVVGCGRVGSVVGAALHDAGHRVVGYSGLSEESRARANRHLPGVPSMLPEKVVEISELVLLTPPARRLTSLVDHLVTVKAFQPGQIVVHTHPRFGIDVLQGIPNVLPIALHPATRFTGSRADLARLRVSRAAVTTMPSRRAVAEALAIEVGCEPMWIDEELRPIYAAGLSLAADHVGAVFAVVAERLRDSGIDAPEDLLSGYLQACSEVVGMRASRPHGAAENADAEWLAADLRVLSGGVPDPRSLYRAQARLVLSFALLHGDELDLHDDAVFDALSVDEAPKG